MASKKQKPSQEGTEGLSAALDPDITVISGEYINLPEVPLKPEFNTRPVAPKEKSRLASIMSGDLIKKINKAAGGDLIKSAIEKAAKGVKKISSGVFTLDFALGGGYQVGMIHTFFGPQSGGKTSAVLRAIAQAQQLCGNCWTRQVPKLNKAGEETDKWECECKDFRQVIAAYIDVEGTLDLEWAKRLGVDIERLLVSVPEYAEEALDMLEAFIREGTIDVIALDSLAFMSPKVEVENSNSKEYMGLQARANTKGIRKMVSALNAMELKPEARRPTIFFTNQIRMQIGVMFGNPETVPGGKAARFAAATEVRFSAGKYHIPEGKDNPNALGKPDYADFHFKVEKNKTAVPKIESDYRLVCEAFENKKLGDIWDEPDLISFAEKTGLLTGHGASWNYDGANYKGKKDLEHQLMYNYKLKDQLWADIMRITSA
jgi:recombination protein RecA